MHPNSIWKRIESRKGSWRGPIPMFCPKSFVRRSAKDLCYFVPGVSPSLAIKTRLRKRFIGSGAIQWCCAGFANIKRVARDKG